MKDRNRQR